jgi:hypothetical protein
MHLPYSLFKTLRRQGVYFVLFDFIYVFISGELPPRDSIFLTDRSIISTLQTGPSRWFSYLAAWFDSGLLVAPPPSDYDCILNEPIWFNRFLYLVSNSKHGRLLDKNIENSLIRRGFLHLSDLLSMSPSTGSSSPWLSEEDAIFKAGSTKLGSGLFSIINLIPADWSNIVRKKIRESFRIGDKVISMSDCTSLPYLVYRILDCLQSKLLCDAFRFVHGSNAPLFVKANFEVSLSKASIVKACVFEMTTLQCEFPVFIYCGNYRSSKLLLSRLSWNAGASSIGFFDLKVKVIYAAIMDAKPSTISAIEKWDKHLHFLLIGPI